jgi:hypothetical protein
VVIVVSGMVMFSRYQSTGGATGATPTSWPQDTSIERDSQRPTLVMFVHPRCPCSRASLEELNRILARSAKGLATHLLFTRSNEASQEWSRTDLWRTANSIPGITVREDLDGKEARRFGAETSGHVVLYDAQGHLQFSGGITGARGHAGDNAGEQTIRALVEGGPATISRTKVFGCSLFEKCEMPQRATSP